MNLPIRKRPFANRVVVFERIPAALVGRVSSLTTAMCFALMPFGGLVGGALVSWQGLTFAMLAVGALYFVVTMLPALNPRWREMDRRPVAQPSPEPPDGREPVPDPVVGIERS